MAQSNATFYIERRNAWWEFSEICIDNQIITSYNVINLHVINYLTDIFKEITMSDTVKTNGIEENDFVEGQVIDETMVGAEPETETTEEDVYSSAKDTANSAKDTVGAAGKTINEAIKQVEKQFESFGKKLGSALQDRANVVMVRVNDDSLAYLDMLVDADVTKSRSESAAFLINEGIKSNEALFNRIREITDQISALRSQLRTAVSSEDFEA